MFCFGRGLPTFGGFPLSPGEELIGIQERGRRRATNVNEMIFCPKENVGDGVLF